MSKSLYAKDPDGLEFEVVWRRNPGKDDGRVLVVVQKQDVVVGESEKTEWVVLSHE